MTKKKTHEEFLEQIRDRLSEYEVLSKYNGATNKVLFRHKTCGNEFAMKPMHFVYGEGCKNCARRKIKESKEHDFETFLKGLPKKYKDWKFDNYTNATSEVWATCPKCGAKKKYSSAKQFVVGQAGCRICGNTRRTDDKKIAEQLDKLGWEYLGRRKARPTASGYSWQQLEVRCKTCREEKVSSLTNLKKYKCSICSGNYHGTSKEEDEVFEWVKQYCPDAVQSDKSVLRALGKRGYEVDIYVPSKKVGIEYNGRFWHSAQKLSEIDEETGKQRMTYAEAKQFHYKKSIESERAGVRLIHIWDYEWADEQKRKVLKNIILGALGMLPERYYARDTICKHYRRGCDRWEELGRFFAENNIQGNRGGSDVFTLEDKAGRVLMAYKFGRPSGGRAKKLYQYEMVRGASAYGVQVIGGASKLWSHFVKEMSPESVVYYIDYNYFDGRSVKKLGGEFVCSQPGVKNYWVKEKQIKNREPRRHKEVKQAIDEGRVLELWNAGTKTFVFRFNQ